MNGNRYLLDTNAIIQLFDGNGEIEKILNRADFVAMSVISEFEYNSFRTCTNVFNIPSDDPIFTQLVIKARKEYGMKLPDAIIAATARANGLTVLTADEHFKRLKSPWKVKFYAVS